MGESFQVQVRSNYETNIIERLSFHKDYSKWHLRISLEICRPLS